MEDTLKSFFNIAVSSETEKNYFPWDSVSCYLQNNLKNVLTLDNANVFCNFFIKILENDVCEETVIFKRVIDVMTVLLLENERRNFRERVNRSDPYEDFFRSKRGNDLALSALYLSKKRKESVFPERECIQVINALKTGNHRLMQVLATYGCCSLKISNESFFAKKVASAMIRNFLDTLEIQIMFYSGHQRLFENGFSHSGYSEFLELEKLNSSIENEPKLLNVQPNYYDLMHLSRDPLWRPITVRFKRLFLIILGMYALSLKLENRPEELNFVRCLDIFFKTTSEPYLTITEVRSLLINYFKSIHKESLLDKLCEVFKEAMPFYAKNFEPRRLCHLARCQVRENLCKSTSTLPAVLDQNEIPKQMKNFLLCLPSEEKTEWCSYSSYSVVKTGSA